MSIIEILRTSVDIIGLKVEGKKMLRGRTLVGVWRKKPNERERERERQRETESERERENFKPWKKIINYN